MKVEVIKAKQLGVKGMNKVALSCQFSGVG